MGSGGGGKKSGGVELPFYHLSAHLGVCLFREGTSLLRVTIGDKEVYDGEASINQDLDVNLPDLFGGDKREGGVAGTISALLGGRDQTLPERLAARLGLTSATSPAYRGILSLFFTGRAGGRNGFYWTANTPYIKQIATRVRGRPVGLNPSIAMIRLPDDSKGREQYAANPAHMIFECLTSRAFGRGASLDTLNIQSYELAAQTLYNENFGLGMIWTRSTEIENFINEIIDHIQAAHYEDPATGKMTLKLLRDDYDPSTLPVVSPSNATLFSFQRKAWGEITSEVTVTWTNPETEKEETVTQHDLAALALQGSPVSAPRNYYGIRSQELAIRVAQRDLAAMSRPLAACEAEVSRSLWRLTPGSVVRLTWPEHGINSVPMRVTKISRGSSSSRKIVLSLQEDIFAINRAEYGVPAVSQWTRGSEEPQNLSVVSISTAPAYFAHRALGLTDPSLIVYPSGVNMIMPVRNGSDYFAYELWAPQAQPTGVLVPASFGERPFPSTAILSANLSVQASSTFAYQGFYGNSIEAGQFILLNDGVDEEQEICMVQSVGAGTITVSRGVLDTTPKAWVAGTRFFVTTIDSNAIDSTNRADGEIVAYRLLPRTSISRLAYEDATVVSHTVSDRASLPLRPSRVRVGGVGFGDYPLPNGATSVVVEWANRNRITEAVQVLEWEATSVSPEAGQVTRVQILDSAQSAVIWESGNISGTSFSLPVANFGSADVAWVRVYSRRDGFDSLQGHAIRVTGIQ